MESGAFVSVASTAQTALLENTTHYSMITEAGNITFPSINIRKDSVLELRKIGGDMSIDTSWFEVKYKGTVLMNHGFLRAKMCDVETEGVIDLKGRGAAAGEGQGAGSGTNGGAYGGYAGSSTVSGNTYMFHLEILDLEFDFLLN